MCSTQAITPHVPLTFEKAKEKERKKFSLFLFEVKSALTQIEITLRTTNAVTKFYFIHWTSNVFLRNASMF